VAAPVDDGLRRPTTTSVSQRYAQGKDANLAAILSLVIPGVALGQFYNGDTLKGILMLVGALILSFTVIGFLGIWVWSVVDAYQVAKGTQSLWK
jgi:TM2 domain-containing membrane protein YozV